jgi:hypothetical protein
MFEIAVFAFIDFIGFEATREHGIAEPEIVSVLRVE